MTATEILIATTVLGWLVSTGTLIVLWGKFEKTLEDATEAASIPVSMKEILVGGEHLMDTLVRSALNTLSGEKLDPTQTGKIGEDIVKQWVTLMTDHHGDAMNLTADQLARLGTAIATGNANLSSVLSTGTVPIPTETVKVSGTVTVTP